MDLRRKNALAAIKTLEQQGFQAFLAGGCVRDELLGRKPKDFDIATSATPAQVTKTFESLGAKVVPTGLDHGTVTLVVDGHPIEITTFRKDIETDGRHAIVDFSTATLRDDAERRDFTINAMYQSADGTVTDYFDGREDLRLKRLRFVGDADARIKEDYLRILRLFRFWSKLGFTPDAAAITSSKKLCLGLKQISQERITAELLEMLQGDFVKEALTEMIRSGIQQAVLPDLNVRTDTLNMLPLFKHQNAHLLSLGRLWLLLDGATLDCGLQECATKLRLANQSLRALVCLKQFAAQAMSFSTQARFMAYADQCEAVLGKGSFSEFFGPLLLIAHSANANLCESAKKAVKTEDLKRHIRLATMPLSSDVIMTNFGLSPGPELGALLQKLKDGFRNEEWHTAAEGLAYAKNKGY